ncbi:hypothetical protein RF11_07394 [Thelohanellus kitauei]|uniref:Uncharacterized protein n=1 Tax=Thelohanellus kitauei TaxID=669202 RepID=A0A0C2IDA4_THEKT|nr:hypothetical protein RF11_07394 [Thelohanellus kitauei]
MDQVIIANLNLNYRSVVLRHLTDEINAINETDTRAILDYSIWRSHGIVSLLTIINCYRQESFINYTNNDVVEEWVNETDTAADVVTGITAQELLAYVAVDIDLPLLADLTDVDICCDVLGRARDSNESG